jgi:hypothetical protein
MMKLSMSRKGGKKKGKIIKEWEVRKKSKLT